MSSPRSSSSAAPATPPPRLAPAPPTALTRALEPIIAAIASALDGAVRAAVLEAIEGDGANRPRSEWLTIDQACAHLQCSRVTLYRMRQEGMPSTMVGDSPLMCS